MSRASQDCIAVQTLLSGSHSRKSIDRMRAGNGRGSIEERPVGGDSSCLTKLTLLDLITDHDVKSGALPPGAHMARRSMQPDPTKKIQARRSGSGYAAWVMCLSCTSGLSTLFPAAQSAFPVALRAACLTCHISYMKPGQSYNCTPAQCLPFWCGMNPGFACPVALLSMLSLCDCRFKAIA